MAVDSVLNCVTKVDFIGAMQMARNVEKMVKNMSPQTLEKVYPLLGVPFCVPENTAIKGDHWDEFDD
jgi:hypothetical protein